MVHAFDEGSVLKHHMTEGDKTVLPAFIVFFAIDGSSALVKAYPFDEIIYILKMIVKCHTVYAAVVGDVADGDLVQRLFQQQLFQR